MKLILSFLIFTGLSVANATDNTPDINSDEFQDKLSVSHTAESSGMVCVSEDLTTFFAAEAVYDMSWYSPILRVNGDSMIEMKTIHPYTGELVAFIGSEKDAFDEEKIDLNLKTLVALRLDVDPYQKVVEYQISIKANSPEQNNIYTGLLSATRTEVDKKGNSIGEKTPIIKDVKIKCSFKNPSDAD